MRHVDLLDPTKKQILFLFNEKYSKFISIYFVSKEDQSTVSFLNDPIIPHPSSLLLLTGLLDSSTPYFLSIHHNNSFLFFMTSSFHFSETYNIDRDLEQQ